MTATPIKRTGSTIVSREQHCPQTREILDNITMLWTTAAACDKPLWASVDFKDEIKSHYKSIRHRVAETLELIDQVIES